MFTGHHRVYSWCLLANRLCHRVDSWCLLTNRLCQRVDSWCVLTSPICHGWIYSVYGPVDHLSNHTDPICLIRMSDIKSTIIITVRFPKRRNWFSFSISKYSNKCEQRRRWSVRRHRISTLSLWIFCFQIFLFSFVLKSWSSFFENLSHVTCRI